MEEVQFANCLKLTFSVLRMQDFSGIFLIERFLLMSASKISWRLKQSLGTAICLKRTQETISSILWEYCAGIRGGHIKLSKKEKCRDKLSKANIKLLENSGFEWRFK
jgi:hypothetical protein